MGLFDIATDIFTGDWGGLVGDVFGTGDFGASSATSLVSYQPPVSYASQPAYPAVQTGASIPLAARAAAAGIAAWSVRFPSLWQALQKFRAQNIPMTIEKLYSAMRRFGPQVLTTMIGAAAVADLIAYKATHKSRRMNVANTKALRRGLRRLKGFDRLSSRVSIQLASSCRRKKLKKCA